MKKPVPLYNLVNGMSQELPAHMVDARFWWETRNARFRDGRVTQTPPLKEIGSTDVASATWFSALVPFISTDHSTVIAALGGPGLYLVDFTAQPAAMLLQPMPVEYAQGISASERWAAVTSDLGLYFGCKSSGLFKYTNGGTVQVANTTGPNLRPKYLEEFHGHLVAANNIEDGTEHKLRIRYSTLDNFDDFEPTTTNESDFFDLTTNELNVLYGTGITGLKRLGDVCAIYTAGSIWTMRYVGFDNGVMLLTEQIQGIGSWMPYGVVGLDRFHIFPGRDDFYVFDGMSIQSVGGPIRDFFFNDLSKDPDMRNRTWGYVDVAAQEVRWFYPNQQSSGECNMCVVFNWRTKAWYVEESRGITAALPGGSGSYRWIDLLETYLPFGQKTIDNLNQLSLTIDGLDNYILLPHSIYVGKHLYVAEAFGGLFREWTVEDGIPTQPLQVELVTKDLVWGEDETESELHGVRIDATVNPLPDAVPRAGWELFVRSRQLFSESAPWVFIGTYDGTDPSKFFSLPRESGRIFNLKLQSVNLYDARIFGLAPMMYAGAAEK